MDFSFDFYVLVVILLISKFVYFIPRISFTIKMLPVFLVICVFFEIWALIEDYRIRNNVYVYNFYTVFQFLFYLYFLQKVLNDIRVIKAVKVTMILYPTLCLINFLFIQKNQFHSYTFCLGCLLIITLCIYYFLGLFHSPTYIHLFNNPTFWIISGLMFYYTCSFPLFGMLNYMAAIPKELIPIMAPAFPILNVLLYSMILGAIITVYHSYFKNNHQSKKVPKAIL